MRLDAESAMKFVLAKIKSIFCKVGTSQKLSKSRSEQNTRLDQAALFKTFS